MRPKLVAFDLDGTLLGKELRVRPRVLAAIEAMRARGVQGCIVSGRMYRSCLPFARQLGFTLPVVCYHGAAVIDPATDEVLLDVPIPSEVALDIVSFAKERGLHVQLFADDQYYCEERNHYSELYAQISNVEPVVVDSLAQAFAFRDSTKACIVSESETIAREMGDAQKIFAGKAYVTRSLPAFMEFANLEVDKGRAMALVAQRAGVSLEEVMAIGDSWNDAPLLQAVGFPIAMGSAPEELRVLAKLIVADVEHDGVAEALDQFVLQ